MKKLIRKLPRRTLNLVLVVAILSGVAAPAFARYGMFDDYDFIAISSAVIPERQLVRNSRNNGDATKAFRFYDNLYWGEEVVIHADLPASGNLRIAIYSYENLWQANSNPVSWPAFPAKAYGNNPDPLEPAVMNYDLYTMLLTAIAQPYGNATFVGYLTGVLDGEIVEFGERGVPVEEGLAAIEWSGCLPGDISEYSYDRYFMLFSYVTDEGGNVGNDLVRYMPFKYRYKEMYGGGFAEYTFEVLQELLEAYGHAASQPLPGYEATLPVFTKGTGHTNYEIDMAWGGLYKTWEDLRIDGANPLVFERSFNSMEQYYYASEYSVFYSWRAFRIDGGYYKMIYSSGFGKLGWSHNYYYRMEIKDFTCVSSTHGGILSGTPYGSLTVTLPLGQGAVAMKYDKYREYYRVYPSDENDTSIVPSDYIVRPVGDAEKRTSSTTNSFGETYRRDFFVFPDGYLLENTVTGETIHFNIYSATESSVYIGSDIDILCLPNIITDVSGAETSISYTIPGSKTSYVNAWRAEIANVQNSSGRFAFTYGAIQDPGEPGYRGVTRIDVYSASGTYNSSTSYSQTFDASRSEAILAVTAPDGAETQYVHSTVDSRCDHWAFDDDDGICFWYARRPLTAVRAVDSSGGTYTLNSYTYDAQVRLATERGPWGSLSSESNLRHIYDRNNGIETIESTLIGTPVDGGKKIYYDDDYRAVVERENGTDVAYGFDEHGRLETTTDRSGTIRYWYDSFFDEFGYWPTKRINAIEYPDGSSETISFNAKGQPETVNTRDNTALFYTYDAAGRMKTETFGKTGLREFVYDTNGFLTQVKEFNTAVSTTVPVRTTSYVNDAAGRPISVTDFSNKITTYQYNGLGKTTRVTTPENRIREYTYNAAGRLTRERNLYMGDFGTTGARWYVMDYSLDIHGRVIGYTNWYDSVLNNPVWTNTEINADNRISRVYGPAVVDTNYQYDSDGNITSVTTPGNIWPTSRTSYTYNGEGFVSSVTDPNGNTTYFSYDADGNIKVEMRPNGAVLIGNWGADNRLLGYGAGGEELYGYDGKGRVISEKDGVGGLTTYGYDEYGNLIWTLGPGEQDKDPKDQKKTHYEYDWENKLTKVTSPTDFETFYQHDDMGRVTVVQTTVKDSFGHYRAQNVYTEYDGDGLVKATVEDYRRTEYYHDSIGNLITIVYHDGSEENYKYDASGNRTLEVDRNGNATEYVYDAAGRLLTMREPLGRTTNFTYTGNGNIATKSGPYLNHTMEYRYDANDNLISTTDHFGNTIWNTYDSINRLTSTTDPLFNTTYYNYDRNNNLTQIDRPNGGRVVFVYDGTGRMTQQRTLADKAKNGWSIIEYEYDINGNLICETDARGNSTRYDYDAENRLIAVYPRDYDPVIGGAQGGAILYAYDGAGNLVFVTTADGTTKYDYYPNNTLLRVRTPLGTRTEYEYDKLGRLAREVRFIDKEYAETFFVRETDASGYISYTESKVDVIWYTYDDNGNLETMTDAKGYTTYYYYDELNRLTRVTDPMSNKYDTEYGNFELESITNIDPSDNEVRTEYDINGNINRVTDARDNTTYFELDELGRVIAMRAPLDAVTRYEYNKVGNLTKLTKPNSMDHAVTMVYSVNDLLIEETDALGETIYREYDLSGNMILLTDRNGNKTEYEYDAEDRLTKVTNHMKDVAGNQYTYETSYTYDVIGRIVSMTDANNNTYTNAYDGDGRVLSEANPLANKSDPIGHRVSYTYDTKNRITKVTHEDGTFTEYTYDSNDNVIAMKDERGNTTRYTYDRNNRLIKEADPSIPLTDNVSHTHLYNYTLTGQVSKITDALGGVTSYAYDENYNVTSITDPVGNRTVFTYDALNRPTTEKRFAAGNSGTLNPVQITTYAYDKNGNLTEIGHWEYVSGMGPDKLLSKEIFTYDLNDQTKSYTTWYSEQEFAKTEYAYDKNGNLILIKDPRLNSRKIEYDELNRATKFINEAGVKAGTGGTVTFEYDALGRVVKSINEDNAVTVYSYDAKGRLLRVTSAGHFKEFEYDARDRVIAETDENGVRRTFAYDGAGNLTGKTVVMDPENGFSYTESFDYDKNGNITIYTNRNGEKISYTYDTMNRVKTETDAAGTTSFGYDANGRITSVTDKNKNTTGYVLDANGNIIETHHPDLTITRYEYDAMNRLTAVYGHGEKTPQVLYQYDYRGLVTLESNALKQSKEFRYDENGNLTYIKDEDGFITNYKYNEVNLISEIGYSDGKNAFFQYNGTGELVWFKDWTGETSYTRDALNRITSVSDPNTRKFDADNKLEYGYDGVGNTTLIKYPDGTQVDYYYNADNRVVATKDVEGGVSRFSYDPEGNLVFTEYPNYETSYNYYDAAGRLIQTDEYSPNGLNTFSTRYQWDPAGNLLGEKELGAKAWAEKITDSDNGAHCDEVVSDSLRIQPYYPNYLSITIRPAAGNPITQGFPGEDDIQGEYLVGGYTVYIGEKDASGKWECRLDPGPEKITPTGDNPWADGVIVYRDAGGISKAYNADVRAGPQTIENDAYEVKSIVYEYSAMDRLVETHSNGKNVMYDYDDAGNLISEETNDGHHILEEITYKYNLMNQLTVKAVGKEETEFTYDRRGNLVEKFADKVAETFTYDARNRMVRAATADGTSEYTYNVLFMRMSNTQQHTGEKAVTNDYIIDYTNALGSYRNDLMVLSESEDDGKFTQSHVYVGLMRIMQVTKAADGPVQTLYVHEDLRGTTRRYTTEEGAVYAQMEYDVWGDPVEIVGERKNITPDFAGHKYDAVAGMYFGQARFYDVENRTWASIDPARDGVNWYNYCDANPVTSIDPTGYCFLCKIGNFLKKIGKAINKAFKWIGSTILQGLEIAFGFVAGVIVDFATLISEAARAVWNFATDLVEKTWDLFVTTLERVGDWLEKNIIYVVIIACVIFVVVVTGGNATPLLVGAVMKLVVSVMNDILPSAILSNIMGFIDMAASLISGNWSELAQAALETLINTAISFAKEQLNKVLSKIAQYSSILRTLIGFVLETDWSEFVGGLMEGGIDFLTDKVNAIADMADKAMAFVMNVDLGELLVRAGEAAIGFVEKKIDQALSYVDNIVDKIYSSAEWLYNNGYDFAVNYIVDKGNYYLNFAENLINQGVDIATRYAAIAERTISQGLNKAVTTLNRVAAQVQDHLNKLPDVLAGRVEAFQSQLPQAGARLMEQAMTHGQQVLIDSFPTVQTTAQQTFSRHMQKAAQQMFGRPPFTSPQYSY